MTFALVHATLGWTLAALAALALRRRSADARCWAWRMGLLKGPIALLLAVPLVVQLPSVPTPLRAEGISEHTIVGHGAKDTREASVSVPATELKTSAARAFPLAGGQAEDASQPVDVRHDVSATEPDSFAASRPIARPAPFSSFLSRAYLTGLFIVLILRFAPRRLGREMPRVEGVWRPRVVISPGLDPLEAAMARAHEEAHIRRRDPLWSFVADLVCAALWFAPPVWLCARAMRAEAETACDAAALRTGAARGAYARLLLAHAGPAPANALGGPARRLARRILMLEHNPKPLSRPLAGALLTLGLVALLPWRAVAAPKEGTLHDRRIEGLFPFRIALEDAMLAVLNEPGVKAEVGWIAAQDASLAARDARIAAAQRTYDARIAAYERTHSQKDSIHYRFVDRAGEKARIASAGGPPPWTDDQQARLKALALKRIGSALWFDEEVSRRLGLNPAQERSLLMKESAILTTAFRGPHEKAYLPLPKSVDNKAKWLEYKIYIALPKDRAALRAQEETLLRPYRKGVPHLTPDERKAQAKAQLAKAWALRRSAEPEALALLTPAQRETLQSLRTDPAAWSRPHARLGHELSTTRSSRRTSPVASGKLTRVTRLPDGNAQLTYREGLRPSYRYRIARIAPRQSSGLPPEDRRLVDLLFPKEIVEPKVTRLGGDVQIDSRRLAALPEHRGSGRWIRTFVLADGSVWRLYRDDSQLPRYSVEKGAAAEPIPRKRTTPTISTHPTRASVTRWSGLTIEGPPPGDELGNVPVGVAHDPDGSVWMVYRSRQSAPYSYAVEHRTPAKGTSRMLDYASGEITSELRRHIFPERLPATLNVDGKVWTIHPPTSKHPPFPFSVEPLDHYAPGHEPGTKGYATERRRLAARPPIVRAEAWTEASIRRHLHLGNDESLDLRPDPERPGEEVVSLSDREGIIDRNVVRRRREADGTFAYRMQSIIYVETKTHKP